MSKHVVQKVVLKGDNQTATKQYEFNQKKDYRQMSPVTKINNDLFFSDISIEKQVTQDDKTKSAR